MQNSNNVFKLTALWAFFECSFGGIMHLFKLPFTGFFIGGLAVINISLIAHFCKQDFKIIIKATLLVIIIKATVSPQSPPAAYFAVFFQGFIGAVIYRFVGFNLISTSTFGAIAMVESSLQLIINKTIFYGMNFWKAIDLFYKNVLKELGLNVSYSFSFYIIFGYVLLYAIWGLLLGFWSFYLPKKMSKNWEIISLKLASLEPIDIKKSSAKFKSFKWIGVISTLFFISTVFIVNGAKIWIALYLLIRTLVVILILYFLVGPFIQYLIKKYSKGKQNQVNSILLVLPKLNENINLALALIDKNQTGFIKYKSFIENLITLTLYHEE